MYPEVSLHMQCQEEAMKKRENTLRKDLQKFAEQGDSMTDEGSDLWETGPQWRKTENRMVSRKEREYRKLL